MTRRRRILALIAFFAGCYLCAYGEVRVSHRARLGSGQAVTAMVVTGQGDLLLVWSMVPLMAADRLLTRRDALIIDRVASQTYFLSESLPPLVADPDDRDRTLGRGC
jgi:hypothetical protein